MSLALEFFLTITGACSVFHPKGYKKRRVFIGDDVQAEIQNVNFGPGNMNL